MKRYLSLAVVAALGAASAFAGNIFYLNRVDFGYNSFAEDSVNEISFVKDASGVGYTSQVVTLKNATTVTTQLANINAAVVPQNATDDNGLWSGSTVITWANNQFLKIDGAEPAFADAVAGSKYVLHYTVSDATKGCQLQLLKNDNNWSNVLDCLGATSGNNFVDLDKSGTFTMTLTAADAAEIVANGFIVKGDNITLTGISKVAEAKKPVFTPKFELSLKPVVAVIDSTIVNTAIYPTLAVAGNELVINLGTGAAPVRVDRTTGAVIGKMTMGLAKASGAIANDDAGNILTCNYINGDGSVFRVYKTSSTTSVPQLFFTYTDALNLPLSPFMNIHGDITKDASIIATCDGLYSDNYMHWTVTNGVLNADTACITLALPGQWNPRSYGSNAKVVAMSADLNDGVFVSYYDNDSIYYCGKDGAVLAKFSPASDGSAGNFNYAPLDARTFGGQKFLASFTPCFFPQWSLGGTLRVFDVSDASKITGNVDTTPSLLFSQDASVQTVAGGNGAGDVLMVPTADGSALDIYYVDGAGLTFGCVEMTIK
jgi:hypothetical protein